MRERAVVTGGAGFIGSHLVDALVAAGWQVAVLDDLSAGLGGRLPAGVPLWRHDLCAAAVGPLLAAFAPHVVLHFAAQVDVRRSQADPVADARANVLGTLQLIGHAAAVGARQFVLASSGGAVYGEQARFPADEDHPCRPCSPYGVGKWAAEAYLEQARRTGALRGVALRLANVYGPRQGAGGESGVVARFAHAIVHGGEAQIFGDGHQTRDFIFVGDVVAATLAALAEPAVEGPVNVGSGREIGIDALLTALAGLAGCTPKRFFAPARRGEQRRSVLGCGRAWAAWRWRATTSLEAGLRQTLRWHARAGQEAGRTLRPGACREAVVVGAN